MPTHFKLPFTHSAHLPPVVQGELTPQKAPETYSQVQKWLEYFGYVAHGVEIFPTDLAKALKAAQSFGGITATGEYDEATRKLMSKERCGNPDRTSPAAGPAGPPKFVFNTVVRGRMSLTYGLHDFSSHFSKKQCEDAIQAALSHWSAIAPFTFIEGDGNGPVDILYRWGSGLHHLNCPSDFTPYTNAHAFHPADSLSQTSYNDTSVAGQIHFADDQAKSWTLDRMVHIAIHETGHALGLGHSYIQGSIMRSSANADLSLDDIAGMQALYAPLQPLQPALLGAGQELFQLLPNGLIYQRLASPRNGWTILDRNPRNKQIVNCGATVYLHHNVDGQVYKYGGAPWQWQCIYNNTDSVSITASGTTLYMLKTSDSGKGSIFKYSGKHMDWSKLDHPLLNATTKTEIVAFGYDSAARLFVLSPDGTVLKVTDGSSSLAVDVIWTRTAATDLDFPTQLAFGGQSLYILFSSGKIIQLLDTNVALGDMDWRVVDEDRLNARIACAGEFLFFLRNSNPNSLWQYLGQKYPASPVVKKIDEGVGNLGVAALEGGQLFVVRSWGQVWQLLA